MTQPTPQSQAQGVGSVSADFLNTPVLSCVNVAMARGFVGLSNMQLSLSGTTSPGDGGAGLFYWNSNSTAADDNGVTTITPTAAGPEGRWLRLPPSSTGFPFTDALVWTLDGEGSAFATGQAGAGLYVTYPATISAITLLSKQVATVQLDIWKVPFGSYPPTSANSIVASDPPLMSAAQTYQDTALTGWTTAINAGDTLVFDVVSNDVSQAMTITLTVI